MGVFSAKKIGIYKITCKKNNKSYIGQSKDIMDRLRAHKSALKRNIHYNSHLQKTFNKYHEENFAFEIIVECDISQLDKAEKSWISFFDTTNRDFGFNFQSGGHKNKTLHPETRHKLHLIFKGTRKGKDNPMYGKKHSPERIEQIKIQNRASSDCLTEQDVKEIKTALSLGIEQSELVEIFKVHNSTISKINTCNNWEWVLPELNEMMSKGKEEYEVERKLTIERLFQEGKSGLEISKITSYSLSAVQKILKGKPKKLMEERYQKIREDYYNGLSKKVILTK